MGMLIIAIPIDYVTFILYNYLKVLKLIIFVLLFTYSMKHVLFITREENQMFNVT